MHRSNSVNFSPEGCSLVLNMASVSAPQVKGASIKKSYSVVALDLLPRYNLSINDREKKRSRFRAENSVHLIPVVLVLCGLVLWLAGELNNPCQTNSFQSVAETIWNSLYIWKYLLSSAEIAVSMSTSMEFAQS